MTLDVNTLMLRCFYHQLRFQLPISFNPEIDVHSASEFVLGSVNIVTLGFVQEIVKHFTLDISHSIKKFNSADLVHIADIQCSDEDAPNGRRVVVCTRRTFELGPIIEDGDIFLGFTHNVFTTDDQ
mgnify:CR=1 FL=1|jgi:hypothetical protein